MPTRRRGKQARALINEAGAVLCGVNLPLCSESDRSAALPRIDAMCQKPTYAVQQSEKAVRLYRSKPAD